MGNNFVDKLLEKAKSEKLLLSLVCFAFVLIECIEITGNLFFGGLFVADCLSIAMLCGYKSRCEKLKGRKYKNYRYRKILWDLILCRTFIFVPFVAFVLSMSCWSLFKISAFNFNILEWFVFMVISWLTCCAILLVVRKIYKRIRNNNPPKLPTSFYNKK